VVIIRLPGWCAQGEREKQSIENNELAAETGQAKRVGWAKQAAVRRVYKESVMPRGFASRNGLSGCTKRSVPIEEARRRARQPCRAGHPAMRFAPPRGAIL